MQSFLKNNQSQNLILFFSGWGCDENQFVNLNDTNDNVLILFDYQDLNLNFDFSPYKTIDLIAYSAGVFVASILQKSLPPLRQKIAVNGNPYLFDEKFGLSSQTVNVFKSITLDNYLDFRRRYMVISQEEYEKYNELQSLRTLESCQLELEALQKFYALYLFHSPLYNYNPPLSKGDCTVNKLSIYSLPSETRNATSHGEDFFS